MWLREKEIMTIMIIRNEIHTINIYNVGVGRWGVRQKRTDCESN